MLGAARDRYNKCGIIFLLCAVAVIVFYLSLSSLTTKNPTQIKIEHIGLDYQQLVNKLSEHRGDEQDCLAVLGVFSVEKEYAVRQIFRAYLSRFQSISFDICDPGKILVRFVIGTKILGTSISLEQSKYNDMLILPITENMNAGKTMDYFSSVVRMGLHPRFIFKADMDTFIHGDNLAAYLGSFRARGAEAFQFYGRIQGSHPVPEKGFFIGCFYGVSYPLAVAMAALGESGAGSVVGREDLVSTTYAAEVIRLGNGNWINDVENIGDHPESGWEYAFPSFSNTSIAIHQIKTRILWNSTLDYYFGRDFAVETLSRCSDSDFPKVKPKKKTPKRKS